VTTILPYPLARRREFVRRHARVFSGYLSARAAENWLRHQIEVQHRTMVRRGIGSEVADEQCRQLEAAIRDAAPHLMIGGVA
jgi:hypothetical protein